MIIFKIKNKNIQNNNYSSWVRDINQQQYYYIIEKNKINTYVYIYIIIIIGAVSRRRNEKTHRYINDVRHINNDHVRQSCARLVFLFIC